MGWALVFAGQGLQHADMLRWVAPDATVAAVEAQLGGDWRERLHDAAWAGHNRRAQWLLTGLSLAAWQQLGEYLPPPDIVAGYSVGELPAFAAAGVFDTATALALAADRAACMDAAAAAVETGLLGVTGAAPEQLRALCERFDLEVAIRSGPRSVVLGGPRGALPAAAAAGVEQGLHCTPLNVALASHTRWMQPAAECFARRLAAAPLRRPALRLFSHAIGPVRDAEGAREALARQIATTVAWDDCQDAIEARRVDAVLEIGAGQALSKMWQERGSGIPARSADEFRSAQAVVAWLQRELR